MEPRTWIAKQRWACWLIACFEEDFQAIDLEFV
jgi:hypothetical protein